MWSIVLAFLEDLGMKVLGLFFQTATNSLQQNGYKSEDLKAAANIVQSVEADPKLQGNPDAQWIEIERQVKDYAIQHSILAADDLVDLIISLAKHHVHQGGSLP